MKKLASIALALVLVMGLSACGDVDAGIGDVNKTKWFDFTVNSMEAVSSYKEVDAEEGYQFLVVNVTEKNTWSEKDTIPMSYTDFHLLVDEDETAIMPEDAWDASMMEKIFELEPDEEITADVVFYIPDSVGKVSFVYEEMDDKENAYNTFAIQYELPAPSQTPGEEPNEEPAEGE